MCEACTLDSMEGIDFQDSFVLDWTLSDAELLFYIEASIWPNSKHYSKPQTTEHTCYKTASIKFVNFESVIGLKDKSDVIISRDANGDIDFGNVDSLLKTRDGFSIVGDFGDVSVIGGEVVFTIHT